ncbi:MAG: hypothetical protein EOM91_24750 [Sphingobacteriia bacterium]|nr:hypothetical protein [Sphingobacteriia bacterium]
MTLRGPRLELIPLAPDALEGEQQEERGRAGGAEHEADDEYAWCRHAGCPPGRYPVSGVRYPGVSQ